MWLREFYNNEKKVTCHFQAEMTSPPKSWVACKEPTTALGQVWGHLMSGLDLGGLLPVHPCLLPSCQVEPACSLRPSPLGRRVMGQQLTRDTPNSHLMLISC